MPQLFPAWSNAVARLGLAALVLGPLGVAGLAFALHFTPHVTNQGFTPHQPVPFSHEHHVGGLGLDCRYCHTAVQQSRHAGVPPTETCMTCHSQLWTNAAMLAPVRESLATGTPIRWNRVHVLPDYVFFDHSVHVNNGVGCTTCHGAVGRMPLMRQSAPLTMGWCLDCHRRPEDHLRPAEAIFDPEWAAPPDQRARGRLLLAQYGIRTAHLTDCSVCHR